MPANAQATGPAQSVLLVLTNVPDAACAERIETALLDEGLAACVNRLPAVESRYRWQGQVETAREIPLLIKTRAGAWPLLEARLRALHPYEVPEILGFAAQYALASYARWVEESCPPKPAARDRGPR